MTLAPETSTVKRSLSAHAAIGLLAGALLYIVCLSGSLLVFYEEWQRLETPAAPQMTAIDPDAVQRIDAAIAACFASDDYREGRRAFAEKRRPRFRGE